MGSTVQPDAGKERGEKDGFQLPDVVDVIVTGVGRYGTREEFAEAFRPLPPRDRSEWPTSAEQFAEEYAGRSGVTVEWLKKNGREAWPCDCGDGECEGWQMGHLR